MARRPAPRPAPHAAGVPAAARRAARESVVSSIADYISSSKLSYLSDQAARAGIAAELRRLGIAEHLAGVLAKADAERPTPAPASTGEASRAAAAAAPRYRAEYLVRAAERVQAAVADPNRDGVAALQREQDQLLPAQLAAQRARDRGSVLLDAAAATWGPVLGWYAQDDDRVTPECAAASGKNFNPTDPPEIGLPGIGPHVGCRCYAGAPHANAEMMGGGGVVHPVMGPEVAASVAAGDAVELTYDPDERRLPKGAPGGGKWQGSRAQVEFLRALRRQKGRKVRPAVDMRTWTANAIKAAQAAPTKAAPVHALSVELGKAAAKPKPGPGGTQVMGDGLTYDPKSNSFHPTTSAEADFNSKHPRAAGGKFAKKSQTLAQQKKQAAAAKRAQAQQAAAAKKAAAALTKQQKAALTAKAKGSKAAAAAAKKNAAAQTAAQKRSAAEAKKEASTQASAQKKQAAAETKAAAQATAAEKKMQAQQAAAAKVQAKAASTVAATAAKVLAAKDAQERTTLLAELTQARAALAAAKASAVPAVPSASPAAAAAPATPSLPTAPPKAKTPPVAVGMAVDSMEKASVHSPIGNPDGPGLWHHKGKQLPAYIQHIAKALMRGGMEESRAIATAVNTVKRWAAGGGDVQATTQAAASKALAEWEAAKAETKLAVQMAVQTGSVPVRSAGDGPRTTINPAAKGAFLAAYAKRKRKRSVVGLAVWDESKHLRGPKGTHVGGKFVKMIHDHLAGGQSSKLKALRNEDRAAPNLPKVHAGKGWTKRQIKENAKWDAIGRGEPLPAAALRTGHPERSAPRPLTKGQIKSNAEYDRIARTEELPEGPTNHPKAKATAGKVPATKATTERPSVAKRIGAPDMSKGAFASSLRQELDASMPLSGTSIGATRSSSTGAWFAKAASTAALAASLAGAVGGAAGSTAGWDGMPDDFYGGASVSSMRGHKDDAPHHATYHGEATRSAASGPATGAFPVATVGAAGKVRVARLTDQQRWALELARGRQ